MGLVDKAVVTGWEALGGVKTLKSLAQTGERSVDDLAAQALSHEAHLVGRPLKYAGRAFADTQSLQTNISQIERIKVPANYAEMIPKRNKVLLIGEHPSNNEARTEVIDNMFKFRKMGYTDLVTEILPASEQPLVNAFMSQSHRAADDALMAAVKKHGLFGSISQDYLKVFESARKNRVGLIAADSQRVVHPTRSAADEFGGKLVSYKDGDFYRFEFRPSPAYDNLEGLAKEIFTRERQWADVISKHMVSKPDSKVVMLTGAGHIGINPANPQKLTTMLRQSGLPSASVEVTSTAGIYLNPFEQAVRAGGFANKRFAVPLVGERRAADYLVNVPPQYHYLSQFKPAGFIDKAQVTRA